MLASRVRVGLLFAALMILAGCGAPTEAPEQTAQAPSPPEKAPVQPAPSADQQAAQEAAPEQETEATEPSATVPQQAEEATGQGQQTEKPAEKAEPEPAETEQQPVEEAVAEKAPADEPAPSAEEAPTREPDVIFVPTPQPVVDKMLELAEIKEGDVIYDLGCGDGRIVVTAAKKYGVKAYGFDINPERVKESRENVKKNGVEDLVTIKQADIFELDLSEANVVTLYLLPSLNVKLMPQLEKLKPGSRIVSHDFDMRGAKPEKVVTLTPEGGYEHEIYLWTVPWEKE